MNRIDREKEVIKLMVGIYCRRRHGHSANGPICPDCSALLEYALARLDRCPKGNNKTSCRCCEIHCYSPAMRLRVREVMRYVGPRMILHHPVAAIRHLLEK